MARWRLRLVVETFKVESRSYPGVFLDRERLECGHVIRPPQVTSKADAIRRVGNLLAGTTLRRCYKCAREERQAQDDQG